MKPYYDHNGITIYNGDCLEIMPELEPVDLVVTDPPYNFTTASAGNGKLNPWADLCNSAYWFSAWIKIAMERLRKKQGAIWEFSNWKTIPTITKAVFDVGHKIESLLVWDKDWIGPGGARGLRPSYELVALICHSKFQIPDRGIYDIQKFPWSSQRKYHPAEKPLQLIKWLIKISGEGITTLDPFMGSGTTLVAAKALGRKAIGIEISEKDCEIAVGRLAQEAIPFG